MLSRTSTSPMATSNDLSVSASSKESEENLPAGVRTSDVADSLERRLEREQLHAATKVARYVQNEVYPQDLRIAHKLFVKAVQTVALASNIPAVKQHVYVQALLALKSENAVMGLARSFKILEPRRFRNIVINAAQTSAKILSVKRRVQSASVHGPSARVSASANVTSTQASQWTNNPSTQRNKRPHNTDKFGKSGEGSGLKKSRRESLIRPLALTGNLTEVRTVAAHMYQKGYSDALSFISSTLRDSAGMREISANAISACNCEQKFLDDEVIFALSPKHLTSTSALCVVEADENDSNSGSMIMNRMRNAIARYNVRL